MKLLKEILFFIFALLMFLSSIVIIISGSERLQINWFGFIPFIFFIWFYGKIISKQDDRIKELESNLKYYKSQRDEE